MSNEQITKVAFLGPTLRSLRSVKSDLDVLILSTPTGPLREVLTEAQIRTTITLNELEKVAS